ncbi:MAG: hypothetical protein V2I33_19765 [Kangiellaceae bacterium]|jgi:hypothetical protein|nr:hypothetical protein [Kangiellaceae bacterium]
METIPKPTTSVKEDLKEVDAYIRSKTPTKRQQTNQSSESVPVIKADLSRKAGANTSA